MINIDPKTRSERENYNFLTASIIPRPVAFVTSLSDTGTLNGAPFSYFNIVSADPPMISLSIQRTNGISKDTARNILATKSFVVHITDEENVEKINQTAANYPPEVSEVKTIGLTPVPSLTVPVPGVLEAKIRLECVLEKHLELGEPGEIACDFIIGKVTQFHIDENIYDGKKGHIDSLGLAAISRLAGSNYAKLGETFVLHRPTFESEKGE